MFNKVLHYTLDAILISTVLAGIRRATGLRPATSKIESENIKGYVDKYLDFGEWVFDMSIAYMSHSSYFKRK
ncbi:hypothetical protein BDB01DRAFT_714434 [Pilobolus umbonatus]|nr:hypothetical protein BDB01DRAFT_714434 [Pilobolus umbonatus]